MFRDSITIYHHSTTGGVDTYTKQYLDGGFYVMPSKTVYDGGKGFERTQQTTIVSSAEKAHTYGDKWHIALKDRVVKGKGGDITAWSDIPDAITVNSITENLCGSDVDNIEITGV